MGKIKSGAIQLGIAAGIIFAVMIIAAMTSEAGLGIAWIGGLIIAGIFFIKGIINLIHGGIDKARNREVSDEDYEVQDVETTDLDSFKDEDWRGRVFHGKYDNRYDGVIYPKEGKSYKDEYFDFDNRKIKSSDESNYCNNCQKYMNTDFGFCPRCGKKVHRTPISKRKFRAIKASIAVIGILLAFAIPFYGIFYADEPSQLGFIDEVIASNSQNNLEPAALPQSGSNNNQEESLTLPTKPENIPSDQLEINISGSPQFSYPFRIPRSGASIPAEFVCEK